VRDGDTIVIDVPTRRIDLRLDDAEIAARVEAYEPPDNRVEPGVLSKYAKLVSSASEGAITR
jgi:dihydroxy-acid dehydratase